MDHTFKSPSILSLCPGVLGLERGLIRAIGRIRVVAYVEIEAFIIANLVAQMELGKLAPAPVWSNLKTFDGNIVRGKIDGIIGGYPCQPFSHAGARNGTDDPRHLYPFISGIIKTAGSVWCFFENVEGHLSLGYPEVSADLRSMGYAVEAGIFSAEEVGAPHQRDRLFILAIKHEYLANLQRLGKWGLPECEPRQERGVPGYSANADGCGKILANSRCDTSNSGPERLRWEEGTNISGCSEGSSVDYSERERLEERRAGALRDRPEYALSAGASAAEVGHTSIQGQQKCGSGILGELQEENGIGLHDRFEQPGVGGSNMADSSREGCEGGEFHISSHQGFQQQKSHGSITKRSCDLWPGRPGEQQDEWEEPRTATDEEQTKRGMGGTINGYNFREDLLRAYGNSVVEQTAEIAFLDLLETHFRNYGKAK